MDAPTPTPPPASDRELIEQSEWFDIEWYLQQPAAAAAAIDDPIGHYLAEGAALGLSPGPAFSTTRYLSTHIDVAMAGMNPLVHYLRHGRHEGRTVFRVVAPRSAAHYLTRHESNRRVLVVGHLATTQLFGAERSLFDILDGFAAIGIDTVVIAPPTDNEAYLDDLRARCTALESMRVPHRRPHEPPDEHVVEQVMAVIERHGIQAVHTNTIVPREALVAARRVGIPAVVHAREIPFEDPELCDWLRASAEELVASVVADADYIIANSHATASAYPLPGRSAVVPNIADVAKFPVAQPHAGPVRVALVASGQEKKGRNEFFELARRFDGRSDCEFVMVGPTEEQQREWAASVGIPRNVRFAGYAATPTAAMAEADVVLNLTRCIDAAPRAVLEAMASGLPVVAWARGGVVEQIVDGVSGHLLPFDDLDRLEAVVDELVRSPHTRETMGHAGRQLVSARFSPTQLSRALANAYRAILPTEASGQQSAGDMIVPLPFENRTGLDKPFYVGNRSRFASVGALRFVDERTLAVASLLGQRLFSVAIDPEQRTSRVTGEAPTTSGTMPGSVDLLDITDDGDVITADCENSTISRYRLHDGGVQWLDTRPIAAGDGGYCHGVAAVPGHPHLAAAAITTATVGVHFVVLDGEETPVQPWTELGWVPTAAAFVSDGSMVVTSRGRNVGAESSDHRARIVLVRLDFTGGTHQLLHEFTLDEDESVDGCTVHDDTLYVANQNHDSVMVFSLEGATIRRLPDLEGFPFPHDVAVSPSGRWLAAGCYGDSAVRLRRLTGGDSAETLSRPGARPAWPARWLARRRAPR